MIGGGFGSRFAGFSMTFRGYRYIYIDIRNVH